LTLGAAHHSRRAAQEIRLAHVPEKWEPVFRRGYAQHQSTHAAGRKFLFRIAALSASL
jgi:hypothetical protein